MPRLKSKAIQTADGITMEDVSIDHPGLKELEEKRKKRLLDQSRQDDKTEVNHYLVLVFDSYVQKCEFADQIKEVNSTYEIYYDGEEFARKVGLPVTPTGLTSLRESPMKPWADLVDESKIEAAYSRKLKVKSSPKNNFQK